VTVQEFNRGALLFGERVIERFDTGVVHQCPYIPVFVKRLIFNLNLGAGCRSREDLFDWLSASKVTDFSEILTGST
jgi:hypothetical protein